MNMCAMFLQLSTEMMPVSMPQQYDEEDIFSEGLPDHYDAQAMESSASVLSDANGFLFQPTRAYDFHALLLELVAHYSGAGWNIPLFLQHTKLAAFVDAGQFETALLEQQPLGPNLTKALAAILPPPIPRFQERLSAHRAALCAYL
jgi:hypothetical protein